jgi:hypothetical protein
VKPRNGPLLAAITVAEEHATMYPESQFWPQRVDVLRRELRRAKRRKTARAVGAAVLAYVAARVAPILAALGAWK